MAHARPEVIYVDESGNSGENLNDSQDPVFALAGVRLNDEQAAEIVQRVSAKIGKTGSELKSHALLRSDGRQSILLQELRTLPKNSVFTMMVHKRHMIAAKLVDLLIVETFDKVGRNMYADGSAKEWADRFYRHGPGAGDPPLWDALLDTFASFAWGKAAAPPGRLFKAIKAYLATVSGDLKKSFATLEHDRVREEAIKYWQSRQLGQLDDNLDPAVMAVFAFCLAVGENIGPFKVVHDEASVVERHKTVLMNAGDLPNLVHPGRKGVSLPVTDIVFTDSTSSPQIQIADWIAAATRRIGVQKIKPDAKKLSPELAELVEGWLLWWLWPEPLRPE